MRTGKLTARALAYALQAAGRKIQKERRAHQTPHGRQSVKKLMAHGAATNSIELTGAPKDFDRVARRWGVDYAIKRVEKGKYLLFFKAKQANAITGCFSEYSRRVLNKAKSDRVPIREQLKRAAAEILRQPAPQKKDRVKEAAHEDR
nr:PcfB family protein [uncultured Oscillibacter sp.]